MESSLLCSAYLLRRAHLSLLDKIINNWFRGQLSKTPAILPSVPVTIYSLPSLKTSLPLCAQCCYFCLRGKDWGWG